jgi:hypothetical protein
VHVPARDQVTDIGSMLGAPPASSAANALAAKLLANVPAGYARQSDDVGDTGPSDLDKAVKDDGNADARTVLTKDGFVAGYQALWQKDDGQIIDFLYQFTSATGANDYANRTYADGFSGSTDAKPTTFAVAGIPGAKGLEGHDTDGTSDVVVFTSGGYLVQLVVAGPDASPAFVTRLAQEQYSKLRTG